MSSNTTDLKIAIQEESSWSRRLSITVPAERVQRTRGQIAQQLARGVPMPGFRKGKVPAGMLEKRYGASIDQETIDRLIQETYREALESQGLVPIAQGKVDEIQYTPGAELTFEVAIEVQPEIELTTLSGFTASRPATEVGEEEVENILHRLQEERGEWEPLEAGARPDYGDQALVEIVALGEEGEDAEEPRSYRIVLGEEQAIPDVEAAILTLAEGEAGEFTVSFPEDFPDEERRGQEQKLRISVQETRKKSLPALDDAFAQAVGEFEDLAALRERILSDLKEDAEQRAEGSLRQQIVDQVLEANPFEVPNSMVESYLDYMTGMGAAQQEKSRRSEAEEERFTQLRETLRPQAEWGLKRTLAIEKIAEQEGLRATQDEIDERIEALAEQHERSASEVWIELEKSGQLDALERDITEEKVFDFLKSQSTIA